MVGDVRKYGFGKITNGPITEGALFKVIELSATRETNHGKHFEVRTEVTLAILLSQALLYGTHDNPYRDPVPTLQLLYC